MIAFAASPPLVFAPRLGRFRWGIRLKLQDHASLIHRRFRFIPSFVCECLSNQNGSYTQPTLGSEVEIAATFIEEKLAQALSETDSNLRQIILLTDGVDHRPYRLLWPPRTMIFHVSSQSIIQDMNFANVPKSCLVRSILADLEESVGLEGWTARLSNAGYQGNKPSVWAVEGIKFAAQKKLRKVLENISSLAMQGSLLIGEIATTKLGCSNEDEARQQKLEKIFMGCGFRIKSVSYKPFSNASLKKHGSDGVHILFVAEQLRLSDDQVKTVTRESELAEESGDEDTFEDW